MRLARWVGILLAGGSLLLLSSYGVASVDVTDDVPQASNPAPPSPAEAELPDVEIPSLSEAQVLEAEKALEDYVAGDNALKGLHYKVVQSGVWTTSEQILVGAALELALDQPTSITGDIPVLKYHSAADQNGDRFPYERLTTAVDAANVTRLTVFVELSGWGGTVVGVTFIGDADAVVKWPDAPVLESPGPE